MNHFAVEEYDRYGRPFFDLGHCRYKGGHSSTTTVQQRNIPAQTAREAALEGDLYRYSTQGINQSQDYLNRANNAINNLPQYDWSALQRNYERKADSALNNYNNALRWGTNNYQINLQNNNRSYQNRLGILDALGNQATNAYQNRQDAQANAYSNALNASANRAWAGQNTYQNRQNSLYAGYQDLLNQYNRQAATAVNRFDSSQQAANGAYQRALSDVNQGITQTTDAYQRNLGSLQDAYNQRVADVNNGYADLLAGKLPAAYAAARQAALKDDLEKSMGSTVSNMASRGIMNSSVTNRVLNDISQNASDTLAKQYTNDLVTAADMLSRGNNQYENWFGNNLKAYEGAYNAGINRYNTAATNAGNAYNAATGTNKSILDATNALLDRQSTNAGNAYNAGTSTNKGIYDAYMSNVDRDRENAKNNYSVQSESNKSVLDAMRANIASQTTNAGNSLTANNAAAKGIYDAANNYGKTQYDSTVQNLKDRINVANVTQNAGLALPAAYLGYANQLYSPAQNLYNNMYNGRMGTGTTSSSTSQSGPSTSSQMWGLAGTLGAASIIACFTGGTLITTPDGYKEIRSIKEGDVVLSLDAEDNPVTKKVASVNGPKEQEIWDLEFDNGIILHTTRAQRFYCAPFFEFFPQIYANGMTVVERDGGHAHIIRMHNTGRKEMVYDFTLEGSRAKNIFFANDVAVEGF